MGVYTTAGDSSAIGGEVLVRRRSSERDVWESKLVEASRRWSQQAVAGRAHVADPDEVSIKVVETRLICVFLLDPIVEPINIVEPKRPDCIVRRLGRRERKLADRVVKPPRHRVIRRVPKEGKEWSRLVLVNGEIFSSRRSFVTTNQGSARC